MSDKMSVPATDRWVLRRTIPSDTVAGVALESQLIDEMTQRQWPACELFRVQLAFQEAIINAIRHGNRCDPAKTVEVHLQCADHWVLVQITDQGCGFDPAKVPDPRDPTRLEVPGGRGVLLIQELMSAVHYNRQGNQITMLKRRPPPPIPPRS